MSKLPSYEIVMSVSDITNPRPFSLLETIETWSGVRTYIRQRGFASVAEVEAALRAKGKRAE